MSAPAVFALVLAGGRSSRFGREKAVEPLQGRPLIDWVAEALQAGTGGLAVSAHPGSGAAAYAAARGLPCLADPPDGSLVGGPLAGVAQGLRWAAAGGAGWLATAPCDTPFLPPDLVARLVAGRSAGGAVARTAQGLQPLCALWPVSALAVLDAATKHPPIRRALAELGAAEVAFEDAAAFDNLNTPEAFAEAAMRLLRLGRPLRASSRQRERPQPR